MMAKRKINENVVEQLEVEIQELKKEISYYRNDNDQLRQDNTMVKETLAALVQDESFWSEDAKKFGIVFRLKNILNSL